MGKLKKYFNVTNAIRKAQLSACVLAGAMAFTTVQAVPYKDCSGGIAVNGLFDYWHKDKDGKMELTKTITNNSCSAVLYYIVRIYKAENPFGKGKHKEKDVLLTPKEMAESILPTKQHIVLAPKHKVAVNLIMPQGNKLNKLGFYRIDFQPVIPSKKYGFDVSDEQQKKLAAVTTIGMGVSTAVVVEPKEPDYHYSLKQTHNTVQIKNDGNALLLLDFSGECIGSHILSKPILKSKHMIAAGQFVELFCGKGYVSHQFRLYPDQTRTLDLSEYKSKVSLIVSKGGEQDRRYLLIAH